MVKNIFLSMVILLIALLMTSCQSVQKTERFVDYMPALVIKSGQDTEHSKIKEKERVVEKETVIKEEVIEDNEPYDEKISTASLNKENRNIERADNYKTVANESELIKEREDEYKVAPQLVYSIQTGSFNNLTYAQGQFNSLMKLLDKKELDSLRIEHINTFNVVRLGKFEEFSTAVKLIKEIKPHIPDVFILEVYIKNVNITKRYKESILSSR